MAFVKVDTQKVADDTGGGDYLSKSGIYDITLKTVAVQTTKNDAVQINFGCEYKKNMKTIYGLTVYNKDGSENFGMATLQSLMTIAGIAELGDPVETEIKTKDGFTTVEAFEELADLEVKIQVQWEHGLYNGKVSSNLKVKRFFRMEDNATGSEIINEVEPAQYEKNLEFAERDYFKDGVTQEDVDEAIKAKSAAGGSNNGRSTTTSKPAASPFKKKA